MCDLVCQQLLGTGYESMYFHGAELQTSATCVKYIIIFNNSASSNLFTVNLWDKNLDMYK